ncbi:MAG: site-specific integrase [Coriobacteriales bacterium]|jgi:integrase|nr:site-specific integrase [Coriobacteriales bacterium]
MRVKGNGSIQQVKNKKGETVKNSWQLVLSLGYDSLTNGRKRECRAFRGTKTQARKALGEFRREVESGLKIDADKMTFKQYAEQWIASREAGGTLALSTIVREKEIMNHLLRHLATVTLRDIDSVTVRDLYIALGNDGVGQRSLVMVATQLSQILRQAVNDDIILRNPCERVEAPKRQKSRRGSALDKTGVAQLVKALKDAESKQYPLAHHEQQQLTSDMAHVAAVRLAVAGGLRRGEVLGLSWKAIDFNSGTIKVSCSFSQIAGELKPPKTDNSNRVISLDSQMLADLKRWKARQAEYLLSLSVAQTKETPVITNEAGDRMDGNNLARWWRRFQERYGFEGLRFHDLRHTHATMLVSSGLNIKAVSSRLGHSSVGITLDLYAHAQREDDEQAAVIIGQIMAQPAPQMAQVVNL